MSAISNELKIAIIVPYRDLHPAQKRAEHLKKFIAYMGPFMEKAISQFNNNASFHIFIVEQSPEHKFNRGALLNFNIGNYTSPDGIIGFIGYKKNSKNLIFKTKDVFSSRDTGATCIEAGKSKTLIILNKIIGNEKYTKENTKLIKDDQKNVIQEPIGETELCVLEEFILRKKNKDSGDKNKWFLTSDMAIHYKIYTPMLK